MTREIPIGLYQTPPLDPIIDLQAAGTQTDVVVADQMKTTKTPNHPTGPPQLVCIGRFSHVL